MRVLTPIFAACVLGAVTAPPVLAMDCPQLQPATTAQAIQETATDVVALRDELQADPSGNIVSETIYQLRQKYPQATDGEIVNYLVTAYCPVVAAQGLSDEDASAEVRAFAISVTAQVERK